MQQTGILLAYYNMHREERQLWSTRCTVLMVAVLFVAA